MEMGAFLDSDSDQEETKIRHDVDQEEKIVGRASKSPVKRLAKFKPREAKIPVASGVGVSKVRLIKKRVKLEKRPGVNDALSFYADNKNMVSEINEEENKGLNEEEQEAKTETERSNRLHIHLDVFASLLDYQHDGVQFLWKNYQRKVGSLLADDMGLGKTVQIAAFLAAASFIGELEYAIVVAPATLLDYWESEL